MAVVLRRVFLGLVLLLGALVFALGGCSGGCSCSPEVLPTIAAPRETIVACHTHTQRRPTSAGVAPAIKTVKAGSSPGKFSISSTGEANYVMPLVSVPGRSGVEPALSLSYDSSGATGDGVLGVGFSLGGLSAISRCAQNLADDGQIRGVRYDAADKLSLDGKRLVFVREDAGVIEFRTRPDTFVKVIGHYASEGDKPGNALFFEAHLPSGLVLEYGNNDGGKPLAAKGGAARAWLATKAHDGRGNAMTYTYCTADADGYTVEYALDEIRYTSFEGDPSLEPSRAVQFVYGTKDPADLRTLYSGGMELQSSLRLDAIQMLGPEDTLVRRYAFTYGLGPTTKRTLLTQVEECASDDVCKPPTRFQFSSSPAGFKRIATSIPTPTSTLASPMLADIGGGGLDSLIVPDTDKALSSPDNPITEWFVAENRGPSASPPYFSSPALVFSQDGHVGANPAGPADATMLQPELGTSIDYDQDGKMDAFLHDIRGGHEQSQVLMTRPNHEFHLDDTHILRPFPLRFPPKPPTLTSTGGSIHIGDLDGNGVPDLLQCEDHSDAAAGDPSAAKWTVNLWSASSSIGFDGANAPIAALAGFRCDTEFYAVDINADGKVDILVPAMLTFGGTHQVVASTYSALSLRENGTWEIFDTGLPIVAPGGRVVFLDVNGDGLPDAVESGFGDHALRTFLNTGPTFTGFAFDSLGSAGFGNLDTFFALAAPIDFNNDGMQDLLMPVPPATLPNQSETLPAWAILQATGSLTGPTFTLVDPQLPFEALLGKAITLADPHGPRIGDVNGDGAQDAVVPLDGVFNVFENLAPDQDLLVAVSDGMNAHDPTDPGFVPNVSVSYGHLVDTAITSGVDPSDPARESALYLSHADAANDCEYPRRCVVGPRRVVSAYATNNGADSLRHFGVRYRDGRYHRLGRGFLGYGERIVTDLDTGGGVADFYDNITFSEDFSAFPFAGQVAHEWRWQPGLPSQPKPEQIEISFTDVTASVVPTNGGASYFTPQTEHRIRRYQGSIPAGSSAQAVEAYVRQVASSGGATLLRDATSKVADFDEFGNVRVEDSSTVGVDLTLHVERTFTNDTDRWVLGQLQSLKECSSAAMLTQCRMLSRTTTVYGEVDTAATSSDDGTEDTKLAVSYARDGFGNVTGVSAEDAYGHHRLSSTKYDAEGIFPTSHTNAAGHVELTEFDAGLGVLTKLTDPNQLVTTRAYDGFGRLGRETRPDGTQTSVTLSRSKDGGPNKDAWRVRQESTTTGGADDTVEYDSLGRSIRWWWYGAQGTDYTPHVMQEIAYDALGEHVARRSVPDDDRTSEDKLLFDVYDHDAVGREVKHTTPWNAVVQTSYDGLLVQVTDASNNLAVVEQDPLGRPVTVTDGAAADKGVTAYTYGPFGTLYTVTTPGNALTRMTRDAFGRVRQLDDPDRGTTIYAHDGFGELISSNDALDRVTTFGYDALGRSTWRKDQHGAETLSTTWTWDTAANGIGKLEALASPDGQKTYTYNGFGEMETLSLAVDGESDPLEARLDYDAFGRVKKITYPAPAGALPFAVTQEYDARGHLITVRDDAQNLAYWRLTGVDYAGRIVDEVFGNGVLTDRGYYPDKQTLASIITTRGQTGVQNLIYGYDAQLNLTSRHDGLQLQNWTERFRYDSLERLTCAYFGVKEDPAAPCALSYGYDPNGNLKTKSDVGALSYDDPLHPHAVTSAGSDSFGYDAVGNQTMRPGGATLAYTPFDLPKTITTGASAVTFAYDGDEQRIRKTTPALETLYFSNLYERVTAAGTATEHRYYVHSPERVVAVVTRGGKQPATRYVHVDHLGSVDVLTDESGAVVERRSYDPFGQRRNPAWGQPPPGSFASLTTQGFTGQESDDELGLVNMKGRIYDPKIGRFLTMDPIVQAPLSGQNWNPYTYTLNNPLAYVDPSGFEYGPGEGNGPPDPTYAKNAEVQHLQALGCRGLECAPRPTKQAEGSSEAAENGATTQPVDVGTTGNSSGYVPQPVTTSPNSSVQNPYVQVEGGFIGGIGLGIVPFAGFGEQVLDAAKVLPHGTPEARRGLAVGQIFGGIAAFVGGVTGDILGGFATTTGIGAAIGVPAMVVSTTLVVGGIANIEAGIRGLLTTGSGSQGGGASSPGDKVGGAAGGPRAGKPFTPAMKNEAWKANEAKYGGQPTCENCAQPIVPSERSVSGVKPPPNEGQLDHVVARKNGGNGSLDNGQYLCRSCNRAKSDK